MNISIVVPVYNSAATLPELSARISKSVKEVVGHWELLLVNDGSSDNSWDVIVHMAQKYHQIRGINMMRNYGQHNALLCGIRAASYDYIVTMDDDLQHPPEEIEKLVSRIDHSLDVLYGAPIVEKHGFWRDLASKITKWVLQNTMGARNASQMSAFRLFRTSLREAFSQFNGSYVNIDVLLSWGTSRFHTVEVRHEPRHEGKSNYSFFKLLIHTFNLMTGFSTMPLHLVSMFGIFFTLFGFGTFSWVIGRYIIEGGSVPGFPFLGSVISIFAGVQLFAIGVIGEYLARMFTLILELPVYTIRSQVGFESTDKLVESSFDE